MTTKNTEEEHVTNSLAEILKSIDLRTRGMSERQKEKWFSPRLLSAFEDAGGSFTENDKSAEIEELKRQLNSDN